MTLREATTVGPYRLVRKIARGGMAQVWEATRSETNQPPVALKVLEFEEPDEPQNAQALRRFLEEAELGQTLQHPHLVRTLDAGQAGERAYFAMELLRGSTLAKALSARGPLPLPAVVSLGLSALEALAYIHRAAGPTGEPLGLVHRDLKPSNLFLTEDGTLKVIDFGIARISTGDQTRTRTGVLRASLPYCSPEQVNQLPVDGRSDLFSLALVLHEMLTGNRCFGQDTDAAILSAILWSPVPPLRDVLPEVPVELDRLLQELLQKEPSRRPASAAVARERLEKISAKTGAFTAAELSAWLLSKQPSAATSTQAKPIARSALRPPRRILVRRRAAWISGALVAMAVTGLLVRQVLVPAPPVAAAVLARRPQEVPAPPAVADAPAPAPEKVGSPGTELEFAL